MRPNIEGEISNMSAKKKAKFDKVTGMVVKTGVLEILNDDEVRVVKIKDSSKEELEIIVKKEISKEDTVVSDGFTSHKWTKEYFKKHVKITI